MFGACMWSALWVMGERGRTRKVRARGSGRRRTRRITAVGTGPK